MANHALTVREVAERYGVGEHTVLGWIRTTGELKAVDVSRRLGGRPRWRITPEAIETFELLRTPTPPPPRTRRRRRQPEVIEFY